MSFPQIFQQHLHFETPRQNDSILDSKNMQSQLPAPSPAQFCFVFQDFSPQLLLSLARLSLSGKRQRGSPSSQAFIHHPCLFLLWGPQCTRSLLFLQYFSFVSTANLQVLPSPLISSSPCVGGIVACCEKAACGV